MEISRRIFRNTIFLYAAEIISNLLLFFLMIMIARKLGSEEFGELAFINSVIAIASVVAELGITTYFIKEGSQRRESLAQLTANALAIRYATAMLALGLTTAYALFFIHDNGVRLLTLIAALPIIINIFPSIVMALFRIQEKMHYEALIKIIYSIIVAGTGILLIINGHGITAIIWLNVITLFLVFLFYYYLFINFFSFRILNLISLNKCYAFFRNALPFAALAVLGTIYFRIDSIMIGHMKGNDAVGHYNAAYKLMEGLLMIPWIFSGVILPVIAKNIELEKEKVLHASKRSIRFLCVIALPLVVFTMFFANFIIFLLYGKAYVPAVPVLQILAPTLLVIFISAITSTIINASPRPSINAYIALFMVIINIILNLLLIPILNIQGAAIATFITEIFGLIIGTLYIIRHIFPLIYIQEITKPLFAAIGMAGIIVLFPSFFIYPIALILYIFLLYILQAFTRDDIRFFLSLIRPQKIIPHEIL